jgi:GxxExxY protein
MIHSAKTLNQLSHQVIAAAMDVHREFGCGLLERVYESALAYELKQRGIAFERQKPVPIRYKNILLDDEGFKMDLCVENSIIIELKTVPQLLPIHSAQLQTYLRLSDMRLGLLMNFNVVLLKEGIKRVVHNFPEDETPSIQL